MGAFVVLFAVDEDAVDFLGEKIADGALDDVGLLVEAARCLVVEHLALDLFPRLEEQVEIADEVAGFFALAGGADDEAHALGNGELVDEGLEAFAFGGVLDFTGDAATVGERREDEVTAGDGEVGGGTGTLGADGPLVTWITISLPGGYIAGMSLTVGSAGRGAAFFFLLTRTTSMLESVVAGSMSQ